MKKRDRRDVCGVFLPEIGLVNLHPRFKVDKGRSATILYGIGDDTEEDIGEDTMQQGRNFTAYLDSATIEELKRVAQAKGVSASQIVQQALRRYFESERRKQAAQELLDWVTSREVSGEEQEETLEAWREYEATARKQGRFQGGLEC